MLSKDKIKHYQHFGTISSFFFILGKYHILYGILYILGTTGILQMIKMTNYCFIYGYFITMVRNWTKCLKNQPHDVIKMRDYPSLFGGFSFSLLLSSPSFLWRHMADFWDTLSRYNSTLQCWHFGATKTDC